MRVTMAHHRLERLRSVRHDELVRSMAVERRRVTQTQGWQCASLQGRCRLHRWRKGGGGLAMHTCRGLCVCAVRSVERWHVEVDTGSTAVARRRRRRRMAVQCSAVLFDGAVSEVHGVASEVSASSLNSLPPPPPHLATPRRAHCCRRRQRRAAVGSPRRSQVDARSCSTELNACIGCSDSPTTALLSISPPRVHWPPAQPTLKLPPLGSARPPPVQSRDVDVRRRHL